MEAVALDLEDDLYFADLSKQISLLIMDEDEELPLAQWHSSPLQGFSRITIHPTTPAPSLNEQASCIRESKGTGVFIPKFSPPRRRGRQGRSHNDNNYCSFSNSNGNSNSNSNTRSNNYRQIDNSTRSRLLAQIPQTTKTRF